MEQLSIKQDRLKKEMAESRHPELITYGAVDMAMKIQSKFFDRIMELDKELNGLVKELMKELCK